MRFAGRILCGLLTANDCGTATRLCLDMGLFVKNKVQQGLVNLDMAVIANKAQLPEPVHEKADARSRGAYHLGQGFLADLGDDRLGLPLLAIICQQQKKSRQPPLAGIEQLVNQVSLNPDGSVQDMGHEHLREGGVFLNEADHCGLFNPHYRGIGHSRNGHQALELAGHAGFAKEFVRAYDGSDRFLAPVRNDCHLELAFVDIENGISAISLRKNNVILAIVDGAAPVAGQGKESRRIECRRSSGFIAGRFFQTAHEIGFPSMGAPTSATIVPRSGPLGTVGSWKGEARRQTDIFRLDSIASLAMRQCLYWISSIATSP